MFQLFATRITNNGEDTESNRKLKGDINAYLKLKLSVYRTCVRTVFIHHPLDAFPKLIHHPLDMLPQLLNMFNKFATKITKNGLEISLNRKLKLDITAYIKF